MAARILNCVNESCHGWSTPNQKRHKGTTTGVKATLETPARTRIGWALRRRLAVVLSPAGRITLPAVQQRDPGTGVQALMRFHARRWIATVPLWTSTVPLWTSSGQNRRLKWFLANLQTACINFQKFPCATGRLSIGSYRSGILLSILLVNTKKSARLKSAALGRAISAK